MSQCLVQLNFREKYLKKTVTELNITEVLTFFPYLRALWQHYEQHCTTPERKKITSHYLGLVTGKCINPVSIQGTH